MLDEMNADRYDAFRYHRRLSELLMKLKLGKARYGGSVRTIFMGSPVPVVPILEALINLPDCKLVGVVSQPARPAGRKRQLQDPPIAEFARQNDLKLWQPEKASSTEFIELLKEQSPDVIVTAAYGQILSQDFLEVAKRAVINIHPSLLPKYRGATPVQTCLLNGENKTGVSILFTVKKLDAGNIISQSSSAVLPLETSEQLMTRLFREGAMLLPDTFAKLARSDFYGIPQDETKVTICKKMDKNSGNINWLHTATEITQCYQAYQPWPGVYSYLDGKKVEFTSLTFPGPELKLKPGSYVYLPTEKQLAVQCKIGSLRILRLKLEGRKDISAAEFWNGKKSPSQAFEREPT